MTVPVVRSDTSDELSAEVVPASQKFADRPTAVFVVSLIVRCCLAAIFLGSADAMNALTAIPLAAMRQYIFLPYFPIVQNILGATTPLVNHAHFIPVGLAVKLIPCIVDSLISVWFLQNSRFDVRYRRRAAWIYAFCPLPLILICLQGQWDSLWVLPAVTALALSDLLGSATKGRRMTLLLIGVLLGLAVLSKPAALIVAGLLFPSFRFRTSIVSWFYDASLILVGAGVTLVLFFVKFAANGVHIHQNIFRALEYGGQPGATLFGPADLSIFHHFNTLQSSVAMDFRQLAIIYVIAIAAYQLLARRPIDRMSAAAAAMLICPAIGGLAPQYLFWPLVFILATGRLRLASAYAVVSSCVCLLFFLIPGGSYNPGESLGALLPLRSLRFLGLPVAAVKWFATPAVLGMWHALSNLFVPVAMCSLGVYLLVSRPRPPSVTHEEAGEPLKLRSLRTIVPYGALMVLVVLVYGMVSKHGDGVTVTLLNQEVNRYAFATSIYSWRHWVTYFYWTVKHPYKDLLSGSWWGTVLVAGPLGIAAWGAFALRTTRQSEPRTKVIRESVQ